MPKLFHISVAVPVTDAIIAALVTQKLQEATTIQTHIGALVLRRHESDTFTGYVLIDFNIQAETLEQAKADALAWAQTELARGGKIGGVGEPMDRFYQKIFERLE